MALLDLYERKARLTPGLFTLAPVSLAIAALGLKKIPVVAIVGAVLVAAGGSYLLAVLVGNLGRRAQGTLEAAWSGLPTTLLLRMRTVANNPAQRDIWRKAIQDFTDVTLLDEAAEKSDPRGADNLIKAAVGQAVHIGHGDGGHPLVAAENAQFGLERNIYGLRWVGRGVAFGCAAALYAIAFLLAGDISRVAVLSGAVLNTLLFLGWIVVPSQKRVKAAGFRYATQLFNAVAREVKASSQSTGDDTRKGDAS